MAVRVEGFGYAITSGRVLPAEVLLATYRPDEGEGEISTFAVLRVFARGQERDLLLATLEGEPPSKPLPTLRPAGRASYVRLDGEVVAQPISKEAIPLPGEPGPGSLLTDQTGASFVRSAADGVQYFSLATGEASDPVGDRTFYRGWQLVLITGKHERLIARIASSD